MMQGYASLVQLCHKTKETVSIDRHESQQYNEWSSHLF